MDIGILLNITTEEGQTDQAAIVNHLALGDRAEGYGFKSLFVLEHHFSNYVLSPDPFQLLSYFAGRTKRIQLGTAVLVLPWHHPVRVTEQMCVLDVISGGRCLFGLGRGTGVAEFAGYGVPMEESSSRFVESVEIIKGFVTHGRLSYSGRHFQVADLEIKPTPNSGLLERLYGSAGSNASIERTAKLGLGMMVSVQKDWNLLRDDIVKFAEIASFQESPKRPILSIILFVHPSREAAFEMAVRFLDNDFRDTNNHYQYSSEKLSTVVSYEHHRKSELYYSEFLEKGVTMVSDYIDTQVVGTPEDCIQKITMLKELVDFEQLLIEFSFGRMPIDIALNNLTIFREKVLPHLANA